MRFSFSHFSPSLRPRRRLLSKGQGRRALTLATLLLLGGNAGCGSTPSTVASDSESHFLLVCDTDNDCGTLSCICGVCSTGCDDSSACDALASSAQCMTSSYLGSCELGSCQVDCTAASECGATDAYACESGLCVQLSGAALSSAEGGSSAQDTTEPAPVVDPYSPTEQTLTLSSSADTTVVFAPEANGKWDNVNSGQRSALIVGLYDNWTISRILLQFELPTDLSADQLEAAVLVLHPIDWYEKNTTLDPFPLQAHAVLKSWSEGNGLGLDYTDADTLNSAAVDGATGLERFWGRQDGSEDWSTPGLQLGVDAEEAVASQLLAEYGSLAPFEFDLTALVRRWLDGSLENHGVLVRHPVDYYATADTPHYPHFYSAESAVADTGPVLRLTVLR